MKSRFASMPVQTPGKNPTEIPVERWETEGGTVAEERTRDLHDAEQIRRRAYEIYLARCATSGTGDPVSDWAQAEQELMSVTRSSSGRGESR